MKEINLKKGKIRLSTKKYLICSSGIVLMGSIICTTKDIELSKAMLCMGTSYVAALVPAYYAKTELREKHYDSKTKKLVNKFLK